MAKRDAPLTLSQGAKTYLWDLAWDDKYDTHSDIESKYLDKGIYCEPEAIQIYASVKGEHLIFKNEERFTNDYVTGEPDLIFDDKIVDIKCSWSNSTYKKVVRENKLPSLYYYQVMAYMWLTGKTKAEVAYVLCNTPEHLFNKELENKKWQVRDNKGVLDLSAEDESNIYESLYKEHHFDNMSFERRVHVFEVEAEQTIFWEMQKRIELAQEYYEETYRSI